MASEPDYGQYWGPDGQSAQEQQGQQQPAHEQQPGYAPTGYEQPGYGQQQPHYGQQPDYGQGEYGQGGQDGYGYQQQAAYQPDQAPGYDHPGYQGYAEYQGQQQAEYPGQQQYAPEQPYPAEQSYATETPYAAEQPYAAYVPGQPYAGAEYDDGGYQADPAAQAQAPEPSTESTATWSAAEMYQQRPDGAPAAGPADPSAGTPAADGPAAGGSTAVTGGRSGRRSARGQGAGAAPAEAGAATGGNPLGRLLAAATGRAPDTDRKTFIVRAALGAAALVVLGIAGYAVAGGGSGGSKPKAAAASAPSVDLATAHTKSWAAPADAGSAKGNDGLVGSWLLTTAVVRGDGMGVSAYSATGGSVLWTVAPPVAGAVPCAMSSTVDTGGVGAVLFQARPGSGQACTLLVAVDTATGKAKWTATLPGGSTTPTSVMVSDTQVVAVAGPAATGYDVATGKQSWTYSGPGKYCALTGNGTAGTLLLQSTCADTNPKQQVVSLDSTTGKLNWWRGLPENAASYTVLSASPAVVSVHMTNPAQDTLESFNTQGDAQATIPVAQVGGLLDSLHGTFDPDPALFFTGNTLVAELTPTTSTGASGGATPAVSSSGVVTAFDLVSGKQLWQTAPSEQGQSALVGVDGSGAVVATEERIGQPATLSHFDLVTGKETPGGAFPQSTGSLLTSGRVLYQGSLVAVLPQFTSTYGTAATLYSGGSTS